jgi:TPP-dependent pyruvate/acetoin dehydrogenase alpha subunit
MKIARIAPGLKLTPLIYNLQLEDGMAIEAKQDDSDTTESVLEVPLGREVLLQMFANMLRARLLAKHTRGANQHNEAIVAGTTQNLGDDLVVSSGWNPVLESLCGGELSAVVTAQKRPDSSRHAAFRTTAAEKETAVSIAAGMALALTRTAQARSVVAFVPHQLTRGRIWENTAGFAAARRLPLVVVADRTESRTSTRARKDSHSQWPFPIITVDGRDVIAVYRVTKEAISAARRGHGPTLVNCVNFLAPGRRGQDTRDPIVAFREYLKRHELWSDFWYAELKSKYERELLAARTESGQRN